ncbi:MAG: hypothetical protein ABI868_05100 [Acidobacteriota bacterium]
MRDGSTHGEQHGGTARTRWPVGAQPGAVALALALAAMTVAGAQAPADVDDVLIRVGERIAEFYQRATHVVGIETSTVQRVDLNGSPDGFGRTVESELRLVAGDDRSSGEAAVVRMVRTVNGRTPREKDKKDRAGCTDPNPLTAEPLAFLLPAHRSEYEFKAAGTAKDRGRLVVMIDFASVDRRSQIELIEDPNGHDDCFDWSGHLASRGRIWVDAGNHDVVRVERGLRGPVDVRVPTLIQRRHLLGSSIVLMRDDVTIRYKTVAFSDPEEVLLLPESIDSLTVIRGGLESARRRQTFSEYKRFVTGGRLVQ